MHLFFINIFFDIIMNNWWVTDYKCKQCSKSYHELIDTIIQNAIKNKIIPDIKVNYNLRNNLNRINNKLVCILNYFMQKIDNNLYLIESFEILICEKCSQRCIREKKNVNFLASKLYNSVFITKLFETLISIDYINDSKYLINLNSNLKDVMKLKLISFRNNSILYPIDYYWKGSDYYYEKIFEIISILDNIIPIDIYKQWKNLFLNDAICGHPLASHGWYQESLQNMVSINAIEI